VFRSNISEKQTDLSSSDFY